MERQNKTSKYYSPLRYPGGKSCIFPFVSKLFHNNDLIGISYAEPYAGGAGLALKLLLEEYVNEIYINDLDKSIYSFWYAVLNFNSELCDWIERVEVSIKSWFRYKEIHQNAESADLFDLAKATFFLNRTNISGVLKGGVIGGQQQTGKYKIDARFNKQDLVERIKLIAIHAKRIHLSNQDGTTFINKLNKSKKEIFIYLDPPYMQKGADLYMNYYLKKDHRRLAKYIKKLCKLWMVSYDNHNFIIDLYSEEAKILYQLSQCASNRVGDEVIIFSKNIEYEKAMNVLKSPIQLTSLSSK